MKKVHGIWLPDTDTHFEPHLKLSRRIDGKATYQLNKYTAALHHTRGRKLALDVGGHVGLWSRIMARDFKRVVAYEPLEAHIECFLLNVVTDAANVTLKPFAVADKAGYTRITMPFDNTGHAHASDDGEPCTTIAIDDEEYDDVIDLLKIDVEGYELPVVEGAEATIRMHKPTIIVEQKKNGNAERQGFEQLGAVKLLKKWGMREVEVLAGDHIMVW
jgi:FkbM family methyltransferase